MSNTKGPGTIVIDGQILWGMPDNRADALIS